MKTYASFSEAYADNRLAENSIVAAVTRVRDMVKADLYQIGLSSKRQCLDFLDYELRQYAALTPPENPQRDALVALIYAHQAVAEAEAHLVALLPKSADHLHLVRNCTLKQATDEPTLQQLLDHFRG